MYKSLLLLFNLLLLTIGLQAQNKAVIKGKIVDSISNTPIELATVAVLDTRDTTSALLAYMLSDKNGDFTLYNIPEGIPLKILISFVAYRPCRKYITLKKGELHDFGIIPVSTKQLGEVVIKGERMPMVIRKDTIEFDAEAFKTRPNAVVEDLLKKLPGVEVDNDGTITVMGKGITKILVDGHEFFANDPRIASKNLDADMISKVQIYDDREDDPDHIIPQSKIKKIINLKFKKALKKSIFGKVYGGEGTEDHYQAGGLLNMFRDTLQLSVLGLSNNLNSTGFDYMDLYDAGGLNRGGDAISRGGFGFGISPRGKQTSTAGGINVNTDYGKKLKINLSYLYKHTLNEYSSINTGKQYLGDDTTVSSRAVNDNINTLNSHYISGTVRWQPDEATTIKYAPIVSIMQNMSTYSDSGRSVNNMIGPLNNSLGRGNTINNTFRFGHSFNYNHQFKKKGESIDIDHNLQINPGNGSNFTFDSLKSSITPLNSYNQVRQDESRNTSTDASLTVSYRYPLTKSLVADVSLNGEYSNELNRDLIYDFNAKTGRYDIFLQPQSNDLTRIIRTQGINPGLTYNLPHDVTLTVHLASQWQQVNNIFKRNLPDINRDYFYLLPAVSLNIQNLSISYTKSVQLPNISDMIPYEVVFSPLYSVTGNPGLKPTTNDSFDISYSKYNYQKGINYNMSAGANYEQNGVFRRVTQDTALVQTSTPINRDGRYRYFFRGAFGKQLIRNKTFRFKLQTSFNADLDHNFFVYNNRDGVQNNINSSITPGFSLNWKDVIELDPQYTISNIHTAYTGVGYKNVNYISHNINARFNIQFPSKIDMEGNYTYLYNPTLPAGYQKNTNLLNLSIARQLLKKDRGEVKLSCYDIFNQNVSINHSAYQNYSNDVQSQVIKRYFMLSLQFKFNKSTVKNDGNKVKSSSLFKPAH